MSLELSLLADILLAARDEDAPLEEFTRKVASSPSLATQVVRISNSALYGMEGKITRLDRAVLILGTGTVASIASGILVQRRILSVNLGTLSGDALWTHSLETGICAELCARWLGIPLEHEAYLAGLLHDLGLVELGQTHGRRYDAVVESAMRGDGLLADLERTALETDHAAFLGERAASWRFPESLCAAIAGHHDLTRCPEDARPLATLVRAAHAVVRDPSAGWSDADARADDEAFLADLGFLADDVEDVRGELAERLKEIASVFAPQPG